MIRLFFLTLLLFSSSLLPFSSIEAGKLPLYRGLNFLLPSVVSGNLRHSISLAVVSNTSVDSVEITGLYVKVYQNPDRNSSVVILAEHGQRFQVQGRGNGWFQIRVMNTPGWVSSTDAKLYDPAAEKAALEQKKKALESKSLALDSSPSVGNPEMQDTGGKSQESQSQKQVATHDRSSNLMQSKPSKAAKTDSYVEQKTNQNPVRQMPQESSAYSARSNSSAKTRQQTSDRKKQIKEPPAHKITKNSTSGNSSASKSESPKSDSSNSAPAQGDSLEHTENEFSAPIDPSKVGSVEKVNKPHSDPVVISGQGGFTGKLSTIGANTTKAVGNFFSGIQETFSSIVSRFSKANSTDSSRLNKSSPAADMKKDQQKQLSEDKYVQIVQGPIRVLQELNPESPILGMVSRGAHFPLIEAGDSWCKIEYKSKEGWIERRYLNIVDAPSSIIFKDFIWLLAGLVALVLIFIIIRLIMARFDKVRNEWFESIAVEKKFLLVARSEKTIQRYLTNSPTTLHKTFAELGFTINIAPSIPEVGRILTHFLPDFIAVDWTLRPDIFPAIEHILTSRASSANVLTLFYNVPSPEYAPRSRKLPNAHYFGTMFIDRDIFSLVTPLISKSSTSGQQQSIQKSVEEAALTGDVGDGSLAEVFQFAEIGRKTGCLLVENKKPFGLVFFKDGIIVYAATRKSVARNAVFDILNLEDGRFRFVLNKKPQNSNCKIPTLGILMEWTKELDEANGR